jgi:ligand-binding sensor domain-containing protein
MIRFYCLFFCWLCCDFLAAQTPGYIHFGIEDGLPSNLVYCTLQDRQGYIWFGTDKGLVRFDGERFKTYGIADGLPDSEVLNLYEDLRGRLWLSCFRQKPAFRSQGRFFTEVNTPMFRNIQNWNTGYQFFETPDSTLWIATGNLYQLPLRQEKISHVYPTTSADMLWQTEGKLLALYGGSVSVLEEGADHFRLLQEFPFQRYPKFAAVRNFVLYSFADKTRLFEFADNTLQLRDSIPFFFQKICTDRDGRFWGCLPGKGVVCFDNQSGNLSNPVWYLPGRKVTNFYEDRQGNYWFMTSNEGVFLMPRKSAVTWKDTDGLTSKNILSIAMDATGKLLAGDDQGNVHLFSGGKWLNKIALGNPDGINFVRQVGIEPSGQCWAVTDEGFHFFKKNSLSSVHQQRLPKGELNDIAPKAITKVGDQYWLATNIGIGLLEAHDNLAFTPSSRFMGRATTIAADAEGFVWKGSTEGLFSSVDSFAINWSEQFALLKNRIVAIEPDGKGRLWVISPEHGLLLVQVTGGQVQSVSALNPLLKRPIQDIKNLHIDASGELWLATNRGVFHIDHQRFVSNFTTLHGLASNEVNDVFIHRDTLWAATAGGLSMFVLKKSEPAQDFYTALTTFQFQTRDSLHTYDFPSQNTHPHSILLPYDARLPVAFFASLYRSNGDELYFRHERQELLLPFPWYTFSNLWGWLSNSTDTLNLDASQLNLGTALPPGRYRFITTALSLDGRSSMPVEWEVVALPHWTQTLWLWLFGFIAGGYWLWRFYRLRTLFLTMQSSISQLKLQALRAQINPHFVGNSINAIQKFFYPPDPEKASEYIHLFTTLLRKTLIQSEKDFITLSEEVEYDREYLQMIQLRYIGQFEFDIIADALLPPETPFPAMFLQPILENATIHGLSKKGISVLKLHFTIKENLLICTVTDNGVGIKELQRRKQATYTNRPSKGIEILTNKARMLNHLYHIDLTLQWTDLSESSNFPEEHGTQVSLSFDLNKAKKHLIK